MRAIRRRLHGGISLITLSLIAWGLWTIQKTGLAPTALYSGAALLVLCLFLTFFNARKKLPFLPLLRASTWMQLHIYLGVFSMVLFLLHVDFRMPSGLLEVVLAIVFVVVAISGIVGLFFSRYLPRRMTRSGESLAYEQLAQCRREILEGVRELILHAEGSCQSSTLPDFYREHLREFLEDHPSLIHPFGMERNRLSHRITNELDARKRYLSAEEKEVAAELEEWIAAKDNLDFQEASQRLLKGWLFVHIPLSFSLILLGAAHGFFALLYGGNA